MSLVTVTKEFQWDAAHRLLNHEGMCRTLHGHRYKAKVGFECDKVDKLGRVVDFGYIKELVGGWINEHWDHTVLIQKDDKDLVEFCVAQSVLHACNQPYIMDDPPTAENMARYLYWQVKELLEDEGHRSIRVAAVRIYETPNCSATFSIPKR